MILCFSCTLAYPQIDTLEIEKIIQDKQAEVGVAVLYKDKVYTLSNNKKYPLMSVFKFHVTVTALKKMEKKILHWTVWYILSLNKCTQIHIVR